MNAPWVEIVLLAVGLLPHLAIITLIALIDFVTITRARIAKAGNARTPIQYPSKKHDYSILIPIFGNLKYLKNVQYLAPYGPRVVLCTTTKESDEFNKGIEHLSKKYGFRIFRSEVPLASATHKPNPWVLFTKTLTSGSSARDTTLLNQSLLRDEIIRDSFSFVHSRYCVFLDGDTTSVEPLDRIIDVFVGRGLDISSVRVLASKTDTMIEKLQSIEYEFAMDVREIYPWLTSGACMIAKTAVIENIMRHHSLFFQGGDIEIGKLADMMGYKVGHIPSVLYTDVPETFKTWFRQRVAWSGGGFRHAVINFSVHSWRYPMFFFYMTILVYLMTPLRWYELLVHPWVVLLVIAVYWALLLVFRRKALRPFLLLFPFYALLQVMIIIPLGVIKYFVMARSARNAGLIKRMTKQLMAPGMKRKAPLKV